MGHIPYNSDRNLYIMGHYHSVHNLLIMDHYLYYLTSPPIQAYKGGTRGRLWDMRKKSSNLKKKESLHLQKQWDF